MNRRMFLAMMGGIPAAAAMPITTAAMPMATPPRRDIHIQIVGEGKLTAEDIRKVLGEVDRTLHRPTLMMFPGAPANTNNVCREPESNRHA